MEFTNQKKIATFFLVCHSVLLEVRKWKMKDKLLRSFTLFSGSRTGLIDWKVVSLMKINLARAVSSSFRKLGSEVNENEEMGQRQTVEGISLDSRDGFLLLLLIQQLMIIEVTALEPGWLQNKEKQQCFETRSVFF